jgi:hypothetical protein
MSLGFSLGRKLRFPGYRFGPPGCSTVSTVSKVIAEEEQVSLSRGPDARLRKHHSHGRAYEKTAIQTQVTGNVPHYPMTQPYSSIVLFALLGHLLQLDCDGGAQYLHDASIPSPLNENQRLTKS